MNLYHVDLPDLIPENLIEILETCRNIHQQYINNRVKNTLMNKWDMYWVKAYNYVIAEIKLCKDKLHRRNMQIKELKKKLSIEYLTKDGVCLICGNTINR